MRTEPGKGTEFTKRHLGSIEDLQILLVCIESDDRWWSSGNIAQHIGVTQAAARRALDRLVQKNLLDIRVSDDVRYRFAPGTPELEADVAAWLVQYRRDPLSVVTLLTRSGSVRDFADAFRITRDDDR
jgi:DNA-binding IclR family transcriptional regulator